MFGGYVKRQQDDRLRFCNALWKLHRAKTKQFSWTQITFENNASQPSPVQTPPPGNMINFGSMEVMAFTLMAICTTTRPSTARQSA